MLVPTVQRANVWREEVNRCRAGSRDRRGYTQQPWKKNGYFSLGCVFLELLRGLVVERLPLDALNRQPPQELPIFARYVPQLQTWAQQLQASDGGPQVAPLFKFASGMISINPKRRPEVGEVVKRVTGVGHQSLCHECWAEIPAQDRPDPPLVLRPLNRAPTSLVNGSPNGSVLSRVNSVLSIPSR